MVIISRRSSALGGGDERAAPYAPRLWAHRRAMLTLRRSNFLDQQEFRKMASDGLTKNMRWIASFPDSVAGYLNRNTDIFTDTTGRSMTRFLNTEEGAPYRTPWAPKG